jgi:hypothetical protein
MKKILLGALALAGVAVSMPANAQGVYFGFGDGPRYGSGYYDGGSRYYDGGYRSYRRPYYRSYASDYRQCRTVRVWAGDHYRRIRRCW